MAKLTPDDLIDGHEKFLLRCVVCDKITEASHVAKSHRPEYDYLVAEYDYSSVDLGILLKKAPWQKRYGQLLPIQNIDAMKFIGECNTPLIESKKYKNCYFKDETRNPSGCFKDRENAVLMPYLIENGITKLCVASSGNAALSASLYGRLYGATVLCAIPAETTEGKKRLIRAYGGTIIEIGNSYEECHRALVDTDRYQEYLNISAGVHPLKDQGNKLIAYEIVEDLGKAPDVIVLPLANGSLFSGIFRGFWELKTLGIIESLPKMIGVQITDADPVKKALARESDDDLSPVLNIPESLAEGLVASESFCAPKALQILRQNGGFITTINDEELKQGMTYAVKSECLLPEWTSAAAFAAVEKLYANGVITEKERVVVINTGTGMKDLENIVNFILQ